MFTEQTIYIYASKTDKMDRCVLHTLSKASTFQTLTHKAEQKWNHQALQVVWKFLLTEKTQLPKHRLYKQEKWSWESLYEHLQVKLLFPNRVQISKNGFCPLLCFTHLNSYIRITGPSFVFGLQTLSTQHWKEKRRVTTITQCVHTPREAAAQKGQRNRNITHEGFSDEPQLVAHYSTWNRSNSTCCLYMEQKETQDRETLPFPSLQLHANPFSPRAPKWGHENLWLPHSPVIVIFADHFEVPSSTLCFTVFICWACVSLLSQNTSLIKSKISGLFRSRIFIRSFMAMMKFWVRSSAPCFELFSAAPVHQKVQNAHQKQTKLCFTESGQQEQCHNSALYTMALYTDLYSQTPLIATHTRQPRSLRTGKVQWKGSAQIPL